MLIFHFFLSIIFQQPLAPLTDPILHNRRAYRHPVYYYGDDLTDLPRDVEVDGDDLLSAEDDQDGDVQIDDGHGAAFEDSPPPAAAAGEEDQPDGSGDDGNTCEVIIKDLQLGDDDDEGGVSNPDGREDAEEDGEMLECPRCLATFESNRCVDLLKHVDRCLE